VSAGYDGSGYVTHIQKVEMTSQSNAVDFGDVTQARGYTCNASNSVRSLTAGGNTGTRVNTIDFAIFANGGAAVDFGDLNNGVAGPSGGSNAHGGLNDGYQGTRPVPIPQGSGVGQRGILAGGKFNPAGAVRNDIQFVTISTTGNSQIFGDLTSSKYGAGGGASTTRSVYMGGFTDPSSAINTIDYFEFGSLGNAADFGDLTAVRAFSSGCSNSTRALMMGGQGSGPSYTRSNVIDYITIATIGDATDFGDLTAATAAAGATASSTRGIIGGGQNPNDTNVIEYVTIGSTGNATDFGDLTVARGYPQGLSSSTRGVFAGGYTNSPGSYSNVIDYITIGSTGNATDFGDLTVARSQSYGGMSNSTRGVFLPGTNPDNVTMDYITIASTGNATDYGDPALGAGDFTGSSNGHGGLA